MLPTPQPVRMKWNNCNYSVSRVGGLILIYWGNWSLRMLRAIDGPHPLIHWMFSTCNPTIGDLAVTHLNRRARKQGSVNPNVQLASEMSQSSDEDRIYLLVSVFYNDCKSKNSSISTKKELEKDKKKVTHHHAHNWLWIPKSNQISFLVIVTSWLRDIVDSCTRVLGDLHVGSSDVDTIRWANIGWMDLEMVNVDTASMTGDISDDSIKSYS